VGAAIVVLAALVFAGREFSAAVPALVRRLQGLGPWAPVGFAIGYALLVPLFVPGSVLTLAAGALFGIAGGTVVAFLGATAGACLAFVIARYFARGAVERMVARDPRFAAVDRAIGRGGFRIAFLLRLSPVFPFVALNYGLGLSSIRFLDYLAASIGMLPGTLLYVYYGKVAGDVAAVASGVAPARGIGYYSVLAIGLGATLLATILITRIARRAIDQAVVT
jgi:uncharacterized membrane protein YdjX (TVP38/TMEM64 family)